MPRLPFKKGSTLKLGDKRYPSLSCFCLGIFSPQEEPLSLQQMVEKPILHIKANMASRFSRHPSVSTWHTPSPTLNLSNRGLGCPSPSCPSLCDPATLWVSLLLQAALLDLRLLFPPRSPPLPLHRARLSLTLSTLESPRSPCLWLCSSFIYNKLSSPPYLGVVKSFTLLFLFFSFTNN